MGRKVQAFPFRPACSLFLCPQMAGPRPEIDLGTFCFYRDGLAGEAGSFIFGTFRLSNINPGLARLENKNPVPQHH
jgi:hypothetical protein